MKRILISSLVVALLIVAFAVSGGQKAAPKTDLRIDVENRNPWTNLRLNNAPETFHFLVVSDRTGGHRPRIFSQAIEQINLLQPTFVISVGDLIEGYSKDKAKVAAEWKELQTFTSKLQMPFFYVPGNHDLSNPAQSDLWKERFGRPYYHFVYKDVLFLAMNSDDPSEDKGKGKIDKEQEPKGKIDKELKAKGKIDKEQIEYFQKVLSENAGVRWTFVCLHKPVWAEENLATNGWLEIERALKGRSYTVFAGHIHHYQKFVRQGMNYYQLATTGGGSKLRGVPYGEFDHVAWVTVKKDSPPIIANILLDGIYPENLKKSITDEEGIVVYNRKPVHPVRGKVSFDGAPAAQAQLIFWRLDTDKKGVKHVRVSDALVEADGTYAMSTYVANDGRPAGDYKVTITLRNPFFEPSGKLGKNLLPEKYAMAATTELSVTVKTVTNFFDFNLTK